MNKTLSDPEVECLKLKKEINENHRLAQKAAGDAVERGVLTGELLMQWKALLPHGRFESFVEAHFEGSVRTAQRYMLVAQRLNELPKTTRVSLLKSELSITELLEFPKNGAPHSSAAGREARTPEGTPAAPEGGSNPPADARISDKGKPGGERTPTTPTPASPGPAAGEAADSSNGSGKDVRTSGAKPPSPVDYGKCPNCAGTKWDSDEFGVSCSKCGHPRGEPAGDVDEDRIGTQRSKTVKTVEALLRAFDDLNTLLAKPEHVEAVASCKFLLKTARNWK